MDKQLNNYSYRSLGIGLYSLWRYAPTKRKSQFLALIFLSIFNAFAEVISIGSVIPFLILVSTPEKISEFPTIVLVINDFLNIFPRFNFFQIFTLIFIVIIIFSYALKLFFLRLSLKVSYSSASDLSVRIFGNILTNPYKYHLSLRTSKVITALSNKVNVVAFHVIQSVFSAISSFLIILVVFITLLSYKPLITIFISIFLTLFYFSLGLLFQKKLLLNSAKIEMHLDKLLKLLQESLGSIRDIILDGSQREFISQYKYHDISMRQAQSLNSFIGISPKFIIEAIGIVFLLLTAFYLNIKNKNLSEIIPILGLIIFATQKILPSIHSFYSAWSNIKGEHFTLNNIINLLNDSSAGPIDKRIKFDKSLKFNHEIKFKNVAFTYGTSSKHVLKAINLSIRKGSKVALIGTSGSGKSTFADILMGLLQPNNGEIWIDNNLLTSSNLFRWRKKIAHVPQNIYLLDASILENIAFGVSPEKVDIKKINKIIKKINLKAFVDTLDKGIYSEIGERGINLSGGQKQKIAIARALFRDATLIVFDEATSSLDPKSQNEIIDVISNLGKEITVIMITHQINLVKKFKFLYTLKNGVILKK